MAEKPDLDAIEGILLRAIGDSIDEAHISQVRIAALECLAALDAAGLAVVSKDLAAMDEWIQKWTFPGGIYEDAPPPPKTGPWPGKPKS